jgi:nicotinamide mononucleotide (NMN) deamidase PncC
MFESAWHLLAVTIRDDRVEVTALRVDGSTIETTGWVDDVAGAKHAAAVAAASPAPAQAAGGGGGGDADLDDEAPVGTTWLWLLVAAALCAVVGGALIRRDRRRQP